MAVNTLRDAVEVPLPLEGDAVIADDRRQMDRNTFGEVVNAFGHVPRDVSPKHGPHTLECVRCNERGIYVNGQMQPSLLEEKCFGQPIPKEVPERTPEPPTTVVVIDEGFSLDSEQVARLVAYAKENNLPLGTLAQGGTPDPEYTLTNAEPPEEKDGTPKTRSTRRTPASGEIPANLRV